MKVALVSRGCSFSWGGAEMVTASLARALNEAGHEVTVFVERVERVERVEGAAEAGAAKVDKGAGEGGEARGLKVVKVPTVGLTSTLKRLSFQRNLSALLARAKAGVVDGVPYDVTLGLCQYFPLDVYRASGGVHAHWMRLRYGSGLLRLLRYVASPVHLVMAWFEQRLAEPGNCRFIITNSKLVKGHMHSYYNLPDDRVRVVYNGVDHARFNPELKKYRHEVRRSLGLDEDRIVALFVSNNWKRKGLATIIKALHSIKGIDGPDDLSVVVVGRGNERPFRAMAERLGLDKEALVFAGVQKNVERFYGAADFFVLPTQYDPCSNACMEAMACALPVVTTLANGASEFITDGESGYLLQEWDDHKALGEIFVRLKDKGLREEVGKKASEAMAEYSWERTTGETIKLCDEAVIAKRLSL